MRITLTRNLNKDMDYVNGMTAVVQDAHRTGIRVLTKTQYTLMLYPYTDEDRNVFYPFRGHLRAFVHESSGQRCVRGLRSVKFSENAFGSEHLRGVRVLS